jgi:hypothetical protein
MKNRWKCVRWSATFSAAWISAAIAAPAGVGPTPSPRQRRAAAADWLIEQIPQMRGVITSASRGSRPSSIRSNPR